jgi:pimeloyl-ACP methyl ester carboxylesterase
MMFASFFAMLDQARRRAGQALDLAGLGPVEAPFRIVTELSGARLRAYQPPGTAPSGPVLLIIPAPIKRTYIWDLLPDVSVVRHCLRRGLRVYLLEWLDPTPAEDHLGLVDYAGRLPLAALDIIAAETGEAGVVLAGHSLGGTFAAILAALCPERVRGLVLVDAPLAFGPERGGPLARALAAVPHARALRHLVGGPVPGSFTALLSAAAVPEAFLLQRWADLGASWAIPWQPPFTRVSNAGWWMSSRCRGGFSRRRWSGFIARTASPRGRWISVGDACAWTNFAARCWLWSTRPATSSRLPPSWKAWPRCRQRRPGACCNTGASAVRRCNIWARSLARQPMRACGRKSWTGFPPVGSPAPEPCRTSCQSGGLHPRERAGRGARGGSRRSHNHSARF